MTSSWMSSIGRRIGARRRLYDPTGRTEPLAKQAGPAVLEPAQRAMAGRSGPGSSTGRAPPISDSIRFAYAERKRAALAIADQATAELAECSTGQAEAAIAKVAGIAHQLAGSAGYFDETELGNLAAVVDVRLRSASSDDRRAVTDAIADFRAALVESECPAQAKRSVHPSVQRKG